MDIRKKLIKETEERAEKMKISDYCEICGESEERCDCYHDFSFTCSRGCKIYGRIRK